MRADMHFLLLSFRVAERSLQNGNLPFGCILVDDKGNLLEEGENTVLTSKDNIAHCEVNLVHQLAGKYEWEFLHQCTVYASTEPCPMCAASLYWSGIGRLVYALSKEGYHALAKTVKPDQLFSMSARELLQYGGRKMEVVGPMMEKQASRIYKVWLEQDSING